MELISDKEMADQCVDIYLNHLCNNLTPQQIQIVHGKLVERLLESDGDTGRSLLETKVENHIIGYSKNSPLIYLSCLRDPSVNTIIKCLRHNGESIAFISNPTEQMCEEALKSTLGEAIGLIDNPSEEMKELAVSLYSGNIRHIKDPSLKLCKKALHANPETIIHLEQTEELCALAFDYGWECFPLLEIKTDSMIRKAIEKCPDFIQYVENPSLELCRVAIRRDPNSFVHLENPSLNLIHNALELDGTLLEFVENQTESMCLTACCDKNNDVLAYVKDKTYRVCKLAVESRPSNIRYVENPSEELQEIAVRGSGGALAYIENPSYMVQKIAVSNCFSAIQFVPFEQRTVDLCMDAVSGGGEKAFFFIGKVFPDKVALLSYVKYKIDLFENMEFPEYLIRECLDEGTLVISELPERLLTKKLVEDYQEMDTLLEDLVI